MCSLETECVLLLSNVSSIFSVECGAGEGLSGAAHARGQAFQRDKIIHLAHTTYNTHNTHSTHNTHNTRNAGAGLSGAAL